MRTMTRCGSYVSWCIFEERVCDELAWDEQFCILYAEQHDFNFFAWTFKVAFISISSGSVSIGNRNLKRKAKSEDKLKWRLGLFLQPLSSAYPNWFLKNFPVVMRRITIPYPTTTDHKSYNHITFIQVVIEMSWINGWKIWNRAIQFIVTQLA